MDTTIPNILKAGLPALNYDLSDTPEDARAHIRVAQSQSPIAMGPVGPEILSYELARAVLRDSRFSVPPGITLIGQGVTSGPLFDKVMASLLCISDEAHQRLRKLVSKAFTPRATSRLHDTINHVVNGLIDQVVDSGRLDVVVDIAKPYPIPIICALLGAPREDWQLFSAWTENILKAFNFSTNLAEEEPAIMRAWGELDAYVDDMINLRRHNLTDDLLSELIRAENDGDRLSVDELRMMAAALLMAGTDTTRNQLPASVQVLCEHPDQWAILQGDPDFAMRAVEESMRHSPIVCGTFRTVTQDVELGGYIFPAGTFVMVNTGAANRDPEVYEDPDRFDITRKEVPPILTFGGGRHYCLGANLARLELAEALATLARRLPGLHRVEPAPWKPMLGFTGPIRLVMEFETKSVATANA
ncbi:cytochrome P450 [Mycobacterium sp. E2238]|uniref:cytochrome P450 n=1 Tax=Mycobacterium sp. E2238 TaxID=1834131 RepID=UPI0009EF1E64|nr:cytochrome P450 [Mycobacterium sp. E2238]